MKKSTKLLSVILAIIMIFSTMSVMASAKVAEYKTVDNLNGLNAYSPYGTVTRLSTEERLSLTCDSLDLLLAQANIKLDPISVLGINININLTSVDNLCATLDSLKAAMNEGVWKLAKAIVDLGILEQINLDNWVAGVNRGSGENSHQEFVQNLLNVLSANTGVIGTVFTNGIQLGLVGRFIPGLSLSKINKMISDLPATIKELIYPLFSRPDDDSNTRNIYVKREQDLAKTVNDFANGLFLKQMSWTSYRVDASGTPLGYTLDLPWTEGTTRYFVDNGDGTITQRDYRYKDDNESNVGKWTDTVTYTMEKEFDTADCETYVYRAPAGYNGDATLKWYKSDNFTTKDGVAQSGYWLRDLKNAYGDQQVFDLNGDDSIVSILYRFIPYVFNEMAPIVLNGSVKKLLAEAFDVEFSFIGNRETDELKAAVDVNSANAGDFFTKAQEYYLWEYTDYKVIDGVPYYRYQEKYYKGTIPSNISTYYSMFNWDYKIEKGFIDEFIPGADGSDSGVGYSTILQGLNKFVYKVLDTVLVKSFQLKDGTTYNLRDEMGWQDGGNDLALNNLLRSARAVFEIAPTEMFDEYYNDPNFSPYYNMMMNGTLNEAVTGLICALVDMLVPQAILPKESELCGEQGVNVEDADDVPFIAIGAVLVRELCTQLMPSYDFDALIYTTDGYKTKTLLKGADYGVDYWLDTVLLMGVDLGMYYLRNITDLGEDDATNGYFGAMANLGAAPNADANKRTYAAGATYVNGTPNWLIKVDWIVDWALISDANIEWGWNMGNLVDCGANVSLTSYENPWNKLDTILLKILPFNQLLNDSGRENTSKTFLEYILRDKFVGAILNLDLPTLVSTFNVPTGYFRNTNILNQVVLFVKNLLNNLLFKVAGNANIIPNEITSIGTLLNQDNIKNTVVNLVGALDDAGRNGLLVTALPIINMFVGWNTAAQKYAEPNVYILGSWGDDYMNAMSGCENNLYFVNTSSGMLETHRDPNNKIADDNDKPYNIVIKSVEADNGCTVDFAQATVAPGETKVMKITPPATDCVVKFTITYAYTGKDGGDLGGDQVKSIYKYVSHTDDQQNENVDIGEDADAKYTGISAYSKYVFTEDIFNSVTGHTVTIYEKQPSEGLGAIAGQRAQGLKFSTINSDIPIPQDSKAYNKFTHYAASERAAAGWPAQTEYIEDASVEGKLFKACNGITAETFSQDNSEKNGLYGIYDMGKIAVKYDYFMKRGWPWNDYNPNDGDSKVWEFDFVYYNEYGIDAVVDKYINMDLRLSDYTAEGADAYTAYDEALRTAVKWATFPKRADYVTATQPNLKPAIEDLDAKYEALEKFRKVNTVTNDNDPVKSVRDALAAVETDKTRDLNFQDHALFEYFQYEKQRTSARAMIKACTAPGLPEKFIEGEGVSAKVIDAIIANAVSAEQVLGINATVTEPTAEELEKAQKAHDNFVMPYYSELQIADQAAKIAYYAKFMIANPKDADHTFLDREIYAAQQQGYVQADYSADSWAAYDEALQKAIEVNGDAASLESRIFDAKYELMKAQNNLIPVGASMKQDGYLDTELKGLIANAEAILSCFNEYYTIKAGVNPDKAWEDLVRALGVRYEVEVDGTKYSGILYDHSAYTFTDYDRLNTVKEKIKVDRACEKLAAALKNFECKVEVNPKTDDEVITNVEQTEKYIQGIVPGSLATSDNVLAHIAANNPAATLVVTASAGGYGTGAKVDVQVEMAQADGTVKVMTLSTYNVIVYGDVNGDSAVDAFDTFAVDKNATSVEALLGIYKTAADVDGNGTVDNSDYAMIRNETATPGTINQVA